MSATTGLHVSDLRFAYSAEGFRVHVPQLELASGKALALAGPSGAGKSTLLRLLTGLLTPTAGKVSLGTAQMETMTHEARRAFRLQHIGLVFQDFALLDYLSVTENILLPHQFRGTANAAVRTKMLDLTERLHIDRYLDKRVSHLSQGERQRVAVARALANNPAVILADEPTGNLDSKSTQQVFQILRDLVDQHGKTIVAVTHDLDLAARMDRRIEIVDGRIAHDMAQPKSAQPQMTPPQSAPPQMIPPATEPR